ncbi:unnamed protein product [Macrosiphum euphorbiae]|uniref:Uncharacterized protein n=1 Tax=Macrosiphum euphorbiae TaxID=13131 RepID=A0AAV0Y1D5_9HEMI|nr:unnamed protein product [Macrosiphum euphorbiae]
MMICSENQSVNLQSTEAEVMQSVFSELREASFHVPERTLLQLSLYVTSPSSISHRHQSELNVTGPSAIGHLQTSQYFAEDQNMLKQTTPPRRNSRREQQ